MSPHRWKRYDRSRPDSVWLAIEDIRECIDEMQTADEIAEAVAEAVKHEKAFTLTVVQKVAVALTTSIVAAGAVVDIATRIHW